MITRYHAKYYANLLMQQSVGDNLGSLSQSLLNAAVDILATVSQTLQREYGSD